MGESRRRSMFKYALSLVLRRKLRTFLTSLGITIAVFLISFIIFGMQDLQKLLVDQFNTILNPNQVVVSTQGQFSMFTGVGDTTYDQQTDKKVIMNEDVLDKIRNLDYVEEVSRMIILTGFEITVEEKDIPFPHAIMSAWDVENTNPYFRKFIGNESVIGEGSIWIAKSVVQYYKMEEDEIIGKKVIIKPTASSILSNRSQSVIGKSFEYTVTGIYDPGQDRNDAVLSIDESVKVLSSLGGFATPSDYISQIGYDNLYVTVKNDKVETFKKYIQTEFNYETFTSDDVITVLNNITKGLTIALVMFGLVSAVVAGIGIVNTMIMSIYEQTKEIGIIKAIGASNSQVLTIFLIQSGFIGLFGGVLGLSSIFLIMKVTDGYIVEQLNNVGFSTTQFFNFDITIALIITGLSILVGVVAGIYPAMKAAKLDPIKALRYE